MDLFGLLGPLVFVFVFVGVTLLVAFTRKGSVATVAMTARRIVLHSAAPPDVVYAGLTQHCPTRVLS
ncbi:hypothetical protein AB0I53_29100 [Saccharopolyspora sp. NPDC050389]|uniref:hypothetical protein n=1 Tax=Saccharopolyspora sp. NPDC050389 TaxID=3155516 RepID=UPI003404E9E8